MIKLLDRYIAQHLLLAIGFVSLGLLGIYLFFDFIHELKIVGRGEYGLQTALIYLLLSIPRMLYDIFPWAALLGALLGLGALAMRSELIAIRVASVSIRRIAWSVLKVALILSLLIFLLGEGVTPGADRLARRTKMMAVSTGQSIETANGLWVRNRNQFIHISKAYEDGTLHGITCYTLSTKGRLEAVESIQTARYQGNGFLLENIRGTRFLKTGRTEKIMQTSRFVKALVDLEVLETMEVRHLERLSLKQLWHSMRYHQAHALHAKSYEFAFWTKVFHPLEVLVMILLAIPFIFGPLRQVSIGLKILTGVLVGFSFHALNAVFAPLTEVYAIAPIISAGLPSVVFLGIGYYMMGKVR